MFSTILEKLWKRTVNPVLISATDETQSWNEEMKTLYELGIGMEDTLQFLYFEKPDLETFKSWISAKKRKDATESDNLIDNVLSKEDLEFWNNNGYVVVKDAVSKEDCEDTQQAIWDFLEMDADQKESWYKRHENQKGLMLNFSDHETLNKNRFSPRIKKHTNNFTIPRIFTKRLTK